jgi:hypothetical protein
MTQPLPARGATDWYAWAQDVHERAGGGGLTAEQIVADPTVRAAYVRAGEGGLLVDALASDTVAGDGATDDAAALQALLDFLAPWGGTLLIGVHALTATLRPAEGVTIRGRDGDSRLVLPADGTFPAITIDSVDRVTVADLRVTTTGPAPNSEHSAVSVRGAATDILIRDVRAEALHDGFRVDGGLGTTPGAVRRLVLDHCTALNSYTYGYRIDDVDGLEMNSCTSVVSGYDGIKLRKLARNVTITGGLFTGSDLGDGIDAYAGGEYLTISGADFSGNGINGITIKTDDLNATDPATYGMVRSATLIGVRCNSNTGNGLWIGRNGTADDATEPLVTRATVLGGSFDGNGDTGVLIRARSVVLDGVQAARNQGAGIRVEPAAFDVTILAPQVAGNGARDAVTDGISIAGPRCQIIGGASIGADPDGATSDADLAAGTKSQRYGLRLDATATGAVIVGLGLAHNRTTGMSDGTTDATIVSGPTQDAGASLMTLPNNRRIYGRKADGSLASLMYVTTGGGINLGDSSASMSILGSGSLFVFPKIAAQGEVEIEGALNHDGAAVGFYGAAPVAKQTGVAVTAAGIHAALVSLGLIGA